MNIGGFEVAPPRRSFLRPERRVGRYAVPLVGVPLVGVLATASYAAWTTNGAGTASAKAGTSTALTTLPATVTDMLYPNGPAADVVVTIVNPNPYPVTVTGITQNGTTTATPLPGRTCAVPDVTMTPQAGTWAVTANGSATVTLTDAATMGALSEDGCQGATLAIPVTLTGASS